jgi:nuclear protein localization family protein 4
MLVRIRSTEGQSRLDIDENDDVEVLENKIYETLSNKNVDMTMSLDPGKRNVLIKGNLIKDYDISEGQIIHVSLVKREGSGEKLKQPEQSSQSQVTASSSSVEVEKAPTVELMEIDKILEKEDGLIKRGRSQFCRHEGKGMCEYCMPLEPYDQNYLNEHKIKHLSFHSYIRKLIAENKATSKNNRGYLPPLEDQDFKIKPNCSGHLPYPKGICSKCQPSAVTLQSQTFRMVDHVEFDSSKLIDNFLQFWRNTGCQRFGYLFGKYMPYSEIPLGVKAVVSAIYEPPQECAIDGIQLELPDNKMDQVLSVAKSLGLEIVGMIYTDLFDNGKNEQKVLCKRHADSYFLSSAECIFSAEAQLEHPTPCKYSKTGYFGSRFITCVVSGNEDEDVAISAYQVSNTCMAMVRDNIVDACIEPSLMLVRETSNEQYIPDVFYKYKNKYDILVQESAKPSFPTEYLLVTLTYGFPQDPNPLFKSSKTFPIENRIGETSEDLSDLKKQLDNLSLDDALSDFHALLRIKDSDILSEDDFNLVCKVALDHKESDVQELTYSPSWRTLMTILNSSDIMDTTSFGGGASSSTSQAPGGEPWQCQLCTFINTNSSLDTCAVCGTPRA